jgi:hypothetical protein
VLLTVSEPSSRDGWAEGVFVRNHVGIAIGAGTDVAMRRQA